MERGATSESTKSDAVKVVGGTGFPVCPASTTGLPSFAFRINTVTVAQRGVYSRTRAESDSKRMNCVRLTPNLNGFVRKTDSGLRLVGTSSLDFDPAF